MDHVLFAKKLKDLHHKNYKLYKDIKGEIIFPQFTLKIDHIQGDPFAAPSKMRVFIDHKVHAIPNKHYENPERSTAMRDFVTRVFARLARRHSKRMGTGKGGQIDIDTPGQQILNRSSCLLNQDNLEIRFTVGLPANGRRILGHEASEILCNILPQLVEACFFQNLDADAFKKHIDCYEDNVFMRSQLSQLGLVSFVANGSYLPRKSGISDEPLSFDDATAFQSPKSMQVSLETKHSGVVEGLGVREGITLIVGGGYHGKSTLLNAIELGIYSHIPEDGREQIVTDETAFKIRSEDGRSVCSVPINPFINNLPQGKPTSNFSTENASGSTSQASTIIEALEAGCKSLLIDEDTSATNFMIRDRRMQELVANKDEPITPLVDRIAEIKKLGVSSILVMGGSGAYFEEADQVIGLHSYTCSDLGDKVKVIISKHPNNRTPYAGSSFPKEAIRKLKPTGLSPRFRNKEFQIRTRKTDEIQYGQNSIDLSHIEQLVDESQLRTIAYMINYLYEKTSKEGVLFKNALDECIEIVASKGFDAINPRPDGDLAEVRGIELACALNRLRTLNISLN